MTVGNRYVILVVGYHIDSEAYVGDSFKAAKDIIKRDTVPPTLISASGSLIRNENGTYNGTLDITFDKNLYLHTVTTGGKDKYYALYNKKKNTVSGDDGRSIAGYVNVSSISIDASNTPSIDVNAAGQQVPTRTFSFEFKNLMNGGTIKLPSVGDLCNVDGVGDKKILEATVKEKRADAAGTGIVTYYLEVKWGGEVFTVLAENTFGITTNPNTP